MLKASPGKFFLCSIVKHQQGDHNVTQLRSFQPRIIKKAFRWISRSIKAGWPAVLVQWQRNLMELNNPKVRSSVMQVLLDNKFSCTFYIKAGHLKIKLHHSFSDCWKLFLPNLALIFLQALGLILVWLCCRDVKLVVQLGWKCELFYNIAHGAFKCLWAALWVIWNW